MLDYINIFLPLKLVPYYLYFIIQLDQVILFHVIGARIKWYAYA
jgi:hypothetical protein